MNRFLDTCVIIGYCFPTDEFNKKCQEIPQIRKLWTSDNVIREWRKKECEVTFDHNAAILEHIEYIKENYTGEITEGSKNNLMAYSPLELKGFMDIFYEQVKFPILANRLCEILNNIVLELSNSVRKRYVELEKMWKGNVHSRDVGYPEKEKALDTYAHDEDICILVDAHDISIKISPSSLKFLTTDNAIWESKAKILKILKINDIIDLKRESALI